MPPPDDQSSLIDIRHSARLVAGFVAGVSRDDLFEDLILRAAVERHLITIGEAVKRLTQAFRDSHAEVDWKGWAGLRDIVVHAYDTIDEPEIWSVVTNDLPKLLGRWTR